MTIHWKAVEQYFTAVLFVCVFYLGCNFRKFISFGLGTVSILIVLTLSQVDSQYYKVVINSVLTTFFLFC